MSKAKTRPKAKTKTLEKRREALVKFDVQDAQQLDGIITRIVALARHRNFDMEGRFTVEIVPHDEQAVCAWSVAVTPLTRGRVGGAVTVCCGGSTAMEALLKLEQQLTDHVKQRTTKALKLLKEHT